MRPASNKEGKQYMATIKVTFEEKGLEPRTLENIPAGESLLDIIEDNGMHLNSNCGGVCACSTCHVYIEKGEQFLEEISDTEEDFIDRATDPRLESRLGCQCIVLTDDAVVEVHVPDQSGIIGHEH